MKKQLTKTFHWFVALLCCGLVACASDDEADIGSESVAVQFSSSVGIAKQRTASGGDQWTTGDKVGIFMLHENKVLGAANSITEGADNKLFLAQDGNNATSGFKPDGASNIIYYPTSGNKVDFVAYYPYQSLLTNYKFAVDATNQSNQSDIDVLYSNNAKGHDKNSGTVDLQFNHAMSKLSFTLKVATGKGLTEQDLVGAKIEVSNLERKADFDLTDGTMKNPSDQGVIEANVNGTIILPPQSFGGGTLTVILADGKSKFDCPFFATELEEGKNHQYNITVSQTEITVSAGDITIWEGKDDPTTGGTAETLTQYKVGDYYPDPTNSGTAIGVVFWLDPNALGYDSSVTPTGYFGKIVSLNQQNYLRWGDNSIDEQAAGVEGIRDTSDGYLGTFNLISKRKDQSDFSTTYGAFYWIYQKNANDVNGIWYMPAIDELKVLYNIQGTINPKITSAGGVAVYFFYYPSSSEYASNGVYILFMDNGEVKSNPDFMNKGDEISKYVRAIAKF